MNYIYDILINLQRRMYDFYEWNVSDDITHVRKTPIFKIKTSDFLDLKDNKVIVDLEMLKRISNRTEIFTNHNVKVMRYVALFSDEKDVIAIEFDDKGQKIRSSKLLVDEELEVLEVVDNIEVTEIKYEILEKESSNFFRTRKENKIYDYIIRQFTKENYTKLKYLYYDCFEKEEDNFEKIITDIKFELDNNWKNIYEQVYSFFKLSSQRQ